MSQRLTQEQAAQLYGALVTKYKLPALTEFDSEFEIIDALRRYSFEPSFSLRFIRRSMLDKFYSWTNYFHGYIQPSQQSIILMQEYGHFNEKERKEILEQVRQLMILSRTGAALDLLSTTEQDVAFIKDAFTKWLETKHNLEKYVQKTIDGWKKPIKEEEYEPTGM